MSKATPALKNECLRRIASNLQNQGAIAAEIKDFALAEEYYTESLKLYQKLNYQSGIAYILYNRATIASKQGDYVRALAEGDQALKILRQLGLKVRLVPSLNQAGLDAMRQGKYELAAHYLSEAFEINRQMDWLEGMRINLSNLATISWVLGDYQTA